MNHLERFILLPRVGEAIRLLNHHGLKTVVVTNQSGVARGYFPESLIHLVHERMRAILRREGGPSRWYLLLSPPSGCRRSALSAEVPVQET